MATVKMTDVLLPVPEGWDASKSGGEYNELIRKSHFADRLDLDRSRVTQLCSDGIISGNALIGPAGRKQQLRFGPAFEQFDQNRDPLQSLINGKDVSSVSVPINGSGGDLLSQTVEQEPSSVPVPETNSIKTQYEDIRLAKAKYELKKAAEEDRLRNGIYMRTSDVATLVGETLSEIIQLIESDFQTWGQRLAVECVDADPVIYRNKLRQLFSETRVRMQKAQEGLAQELPEFTEEDTHEHSSSSSQTAGRGSIGEGINTTTTH